MPTGDERLANEQAAREAMQKEWAANNKPQLWMKQGDVAIARFLEQGPDKRVFAVHEYTVPNPRNPSQPFRRFFTCFNDAEDGSRCVGCEGGMQVKYKGVYNVIQRNRPVFRKDAQGKVMKVNNEPIVDGYQDEVVIFTCAGTTANAIRVADDNFKGLMSRDVKITKTGAQFQPFDFAPADIDSGPVPLSPADIELAGKKHNLSEFMKVPEWAEASKIVAVWQAQSGQTQQTNAAPPPQAGAPVSDANPFLGGGAGAPAAAPAPAPEPTPQS